MRRNQTKVQEYIEDLVGELTPQQKEKLDVNIKTLVQKEERARIMNKAIKLSLFVLKGKASEDQQIKLAEIKSLMSNQELEELEAKVNENKDKKDWKVEGSAFFNKFFQDMKELIQSMTGKNKEGRTDSGNGFFAKIGGFFKKNKKNNEAEAQVKKENEGEHSN